MVFSISAGELCYKVLYAAKSVQFSIEQQAEPLENIIDRRVIEITNLILPDEDIKMN